MIMVLGREWGVAIGASLGKSDSTKQANERLCSKKGSVALEE